MSDTITCMISIGLIGCGKWGKNHARALYEQACLGAIADLAMARVRSHLSDLMIDSEHISFYEDYRQLLSDQAIDAVVIATPADTHCDIAIAALEAGKDVLVEKPMCLTTSDGERMVEAAKACGCVLQVGHLLDYHGAYIKMRHMVENKETDGLRIGDVVHIEATLKKLGRVREKEDVLWSFGPHPIASILALVQSPPTRIKRWLQSRDRVCAGFEFRRVSTTVPGDHPTNQPITAMIDLSWRHPIREQVFTIHGSQGTLRFDAVSGDLSFYCTQIDPQTGYPTKDTVSDHRHLAYDKTPPLNSQLNAFLEAIEKRQSSSTSGETGLIVSRMMSQLTMR